MIPIPLTNKQIDEICSLVAQDMIDHLGYLPTVQEVSSIGEDCRFQISELMDCHYTEQVRDLFSGHVYRRMMQTAKVFGE